MTLQLLWQEYTARTPADQALGYSQFCEYFARWKATLPVVCRLPHTAGECVYVDYAGATLPVRDAATGRGREAQLFVGVCGASHYLYAELTWTQQLPDWLGAHARMLEFFGGAPALLVPDNLASGVTEPCPYEPGANRSYQDLAQHYGTAILPARVRKPRDKAAAEVGVQVAERWILAPLRRQPFASLGEANAAIRERVDRVNHTASKKFGDTRYERFVAIDRPALRPLPPTRYELAEWRRAKVHIDYHIELEKHRYSVPYRLVGQPVDVRLTTSTVEILHEGVRVAAHPRRAGARGHSYHPEHLPPPHRAHLEWTPERFQRWGESLGPAVATTVRQLFERALHPAFAYRACLGLLQLAKRYPAPRLDAACARALASGTPRYRTVKTILARGLDQLPPVDAEGPDGAPALALPREHAHVRGAAYYRALIAAPAASTTPTSLSLFAES
jgi:transposase